MRYTSDQYCHFWPKSGHFGKQRPLFVLNMVYMNYGFHIPLFDTPHDILMWIFMFEIYKLMNINIESKPSEVKPNQKEKQTQSAFVWLCDWANHNYHNCIMVWMIGYPAYLDFDCLIGEAILSIYQPIQPAFTLPFLMEYWKTSVFQAMNHS